MVHSGSRSCGIPSNCRVGYDSRGTYGPIWLILGGLALVGAIIMFILPSPDTDSETADDSISTYLFKSHHVCEGFFYRNNLETKTILCVVTVPGIFQIPNSKHQISNKSQISNSNVNSFASCIKFWASREPIRAFFGFLTAYFNPH